MTTYRRLPRALVVLVLVLCLLPLNLMSSALADTNILGKTTIHKVNVRVGASNSAKLLFQIPEAGYVGTLKGEKFADKILWYKVEFQSPDAGNNNYYIGYMKAEYFVPLTEEELKVYKVGDYIATPTPIPSADPDSGTTPTPTPVPTHASGNTDAPAGTVGVITNSGVNLRKGPGTNFGVITQLNRGDTVEVLTIPSSISDKTFYFVRYGGNTEGFVMSTFLRLADGPDITISPVITPTPTPVPDGIWGYVITTKGGVNLRQTPGGTVITTVGKNRTFPVLLNPIRERGYTWYFVQAGEFKGYLRGDCVRETKGPTPSPTSTYAPVITPTPTPTPTPVPVDPTGYIKTTAGGLNVRTEPSGDILGRIGKNIVLPAYGDPTVVKNVKWYRVFHPDYGFVYLHGAYVKPCNQDGSDIVPGQPTPTPTPTPTPPPTGLITPTPTPSPGLITPTPTPAPTPVDPQEMLTGYVRTTSGGLNFRTEAGGSDTLGQVSKNVVMPYYGTPTTLKGVTWYHVKHDKFGMGYVHGNYVVLCNADGTTLTSPTPTVAYKTEASYTTLRLGSTGNAVRNLIIELINQNYMAGTAGDKYTTAVENAIKQFQEDHKLTVDGIAGSATQHALFNTVPIGSADVTNLSMTLYPAEKIDWFTGGIQELWKRGDNYKVYDLQTGLVWWAHRWAGGNHADIEPLTAADTARLCTMYGVKKASEINSKDHWQRRPSLVTIGTRTFACSLYGVPHNEDGDTIADNDMVGQICLHFTNSKTHGPPAKVDTNHQNAIQYAWEHAPNGHK